MLSPLTHMESKRILKWIPKWLCYYCRDPAISYKYKYLNTGTHEQKSTRIELCFDCKRIWDNFDEPREFEGICYHHAIGTLPSLDQMAMYSEIMNSNCHGCNNPIANIRGYDGMNSHSRDQHLWVKLCTRCERCINIFRPKLYSENFPCQKMITKYINMTTNMSLVCLSNIMPNELLHLICLTLIDHEKKNGR